MCEGMKRERERGAVHTSILSSGSILSLMYLLIPTDADVSMCSHSARSAGRRGSTRWQGGDDGEEEEVIIIIIVAVAVVVEKRMRKNKRNTNKYYNTCLFVYSLS